MQLEEEDLDPYVDEFDVGTKDDILMIGSISLEEVQVPFNIFNINLLCVYHCVYRHTTKDFILYRKKSADSEMSISLTGNKKPGKSIKSNKWLPC